MTLDGAAMSDPMDGTQQPIAVSQDGGPHFKFEAPFGEILEHIPVEPRNRLRDFYMNDARIATGSRDAD